MDYKKHFRQLLRSGIAATVICLTCTPTFAQAPAAAAAKPAGGPGSLNGMWTTVGYKGSQRNSPSERVVKTIDGKMPPLQPWAEKLLEERIKMTTVKGEPYTNTLMQCLPGGVPEMTFGSPYPTQIIESPGQVTILYEMYNHYRVIYMNEKHPDDPEPTFMGHSIGRWEGDTLVVDTVGLTDRTTIDEIGMPHSENLHVIERFHRVDKDTLEILVTIDDPKTFTKPWDTKVVNKAGGPNMKFIEFICENNRNARE